MSCGRGCSVSCLPRRATSGARSADLVARVESILARDAQDDPDRPATVVFEEPGGLRRIRSFDELCTFIDEKLSDEGSGWVRYASAGTVSAFLRRLDAARFHCGHLIKGDDAPEPDAHRIDWESRQVSVIDIHNLHDRAKRFVVGVVVKRLFEEKETTGAARPLVFLVLDELNKYAPREGWSPIKEVLLDIAERGRSLGVILIGAEQTASEVERRVVANSRHPHRRAPRPGRSAAARIRLPQRHRAAARRHSQAGLDDPSAAAHAGCDRGGLSVPVLGDAAERGGGA